MGCITNALIILDGCVETLDLRAQVEHAGLMAKTHSAAAVEIGRRVRAERQRLGISLEDLGELSEMGSTSIGRIERGVSSPSVETIIRIASALEVEPGHFLTGISPEDYGSRSHQVTVKDLIRARRQQTNRRA